MDAWAKDWDNLDDAVYDAPRFKANKEYREKAMQRYLELSQEFQDELIAEMGQEAYDASQHWINNPLIKPVSKVAIFEQWEARIRKEENERIIKLLEDKIASCDWEQVAKDAGYDDQVCDGCDENRAVIELTKGEK